MPGPIANAATQMQCPHAIPATLPPTQKDVLVDGSPALVQGDKGVVTGCPFTVPTGKPQPCATAEPTLAAQKVMIDSKPALLFNPADVCKSADMIVNGPIVWGSVQSKVIAT